MSITASAEKKFELRKCIEECDTEIQKLKTRISVVLLEQEQQKQQLNSPNIPQITKIELKSEKGVDYSQLRDLLAAGKWKEADVETSMVMCLAAGTQKEGWLREKDIDNFPCEDLRTINQLWLHYSNGKFGFSVQKEIYQSLGGTREYNAEVWKKFCDRVGWRVNGDWLLYYKDLNFDLEAARGHLPNPYDGNLSGENMWWFEVVFDLYLVLRREDVLRFRRIRARDHRVYKAKLFSSLAQRLVTFSI